MARIGLFGGTFNPIHVGHLTIAEEARLAGQLDRVIFIPSGDPYMKDPLRLAPRAARLEMVRRAAGVDPDHYAVSDCEVRREGPSYTCETAAAFRAEYPSDERFLILGADSLLEIETWRQPEKIFDAVDVLAFARGGVDGRALRDKAAALRRRYGARIELIETFGLALSASDVRGWIAGGHAFRHLVTEPVYRYILREGLYGADPAKYGQSRDIDNP